MTNQELKLEWYNTKEKLPFCHIKCFICGERMYYGKSLRISTGQKTKFQCKCFQKISVETKRGDKIRHECGECGREVLFESAFDFGTRFRCTCGHSDIVLTEDIENTVKI